MRGLVKIYQEVRRCDLPVAVAGVPKTVDKDNDVGIMRGQFEFLYRRLRQKGHGRVHGVRAGGADQRQLRLRPRGGGRQGAQLTPSTPRTASGLGSGPSPTSPNSSRAPSTEVQALTRLM